MFIACRNTLVSYEIPANCTHEIATCRVKLPNAKFLIACCVYRPPNRSTDYLESVCTELENLILSYPNDIIWIAGDLNLPDINWANFDTDGNSYPLPLNNMFLDFVSTFGLSQIVNFPTRQNNILDIFLTNRPSFIKYCVLLPGISDHEAVLTESNITITIQECIGRKLYLWNRVDPNLLRSFFHDFSMEFLHTNCYDTPINQLWMDFKSACLFCLDTFVPSKSRSARPCQPWITTHIKCLCRQRKRVYAQCRRSHSPNSW